MAGSRFSKMAWQLRTLDVLGPGAPRKLGRAFALGQGRGVAHGEGLAYVAAGLSCTD